MELGTGSVHAVGTMSVALEVETPPGQRLLGIRFRPGGAPFLDRVHGRELLDLGPLLTDVDRRMGERFHRLAERLAAGGPGMADRGPEALEAVWAAVGDSVKLTTGAPSPLTRTALAHLAGGAPPRTVGELAAELGVSRRHLERVVSRWVGLSPGRFARTCRLRRAALLLDDPVDGSPARVARAAGYADQPHLTREFRALAGLTPGEYRRGVG